jgi:hypothetical protein
MRSQWQATSVRGLRRRSTNRGSTVDQRRSGTVKRRVIASFHDAPNYQHSYVFYPDYAALKPDAAVKRGYRKVCRSLDPSDV